MFLLITRDYLSLYIDYRLCRFFEESVLIPGKRTDSWPQPAGQLHDTPQLYTVQKEGPFCVLGGKLRPFVHQIEHRSEQCVVTQLDSLLVARRLINGRTIFNQHTDVIFYVTCLCSFIFIDTEVNRQHVSIIHKHQHMHFFTFKTVLV